MSLLGINGRALSRQSAISNLQLPLPTPPPLPPCPGDFAVVTCFFNPRGYTRPLANFHRFARGLNRCGVEWCPAELSFGGDWQIPAKWNPLRMRSEHVLWHKESLLNILVDSLPARITKIAWVDADVLWDRDDWPVLADHALQEANVVQLFRECVLPTRRGGIEAVRPGVAWAMEQRHADRWNFGKAHPGFAWAARRELWRHGGLFDYHVTGGGDSLMACAFFGVTRGHVSNLYGGAIGELWSRWAEGVNRWCGQRVGWIDARLTHLWHGDRSDRKYAERCRYLEGLEPQRDIERGANGLLRWKRSREECRTRALVEDYFTERKEDG